MHKVIDDFLDKEDFIFVHNLIMNEPFPWFYMDSYRESGLEKDKTNNFSYHLHGLLCGGSKFLVWKSFLHF